MRPVRRVLGFCIVALGLGLLAFEAAEAIMRGDPRVRGALLGGSLAALATALGTLPIALSQQFSQRSCDTMLGFGAGVMLAATSFSLVIPSLDAARAQGAGAWAAGGIVGAGVLLGAALLLAIDRLVPHEHFVKGLEGPRARKLKRVWLFVLAIALHNLPEGLAIGVAFAGSDAVAATALATGISIQDVPEGMVVALALRGVGYSRFLSVGLGVASGLVEPLMAVLGATVVTLTASLLPWGLALAAGAMLFVISHEIIPESHRQGHEAYATGGLMVGFVLMMVLDTALG
ncbi:ZIP family metal transporter [Variovorax paradoxus]|jgi:ZIP family zinc transporter|nr:ZIP family metal transporter [Variovorax paradoxus]WGT66465.1 ZIP family metal transporter [Variovorax paradoxus]